MNVILVGLGKMGGYHLNAIRKFDIINKISIVETGKLSKELSDNEVVFESLESCLENGHHDLAVVASPTVTHVEIAEKLLNKGVKTLIEKPISHTIDTASSLERFKDILAVGHIERFNPIVESINQLLSDRHQKINFCSFSRLSTKPTRISDVGVDLDLSIHDLDLAAHMFGKLDKINDHKIKDEDDRVVDAKYELLCGKATVSIHSSWLHQNLERKIILKTDEDEIIGDLANKTLTLNNIPIEVNLSDADQLTKQFKEFLKFANGQSSRVSTYEDAISVLKLV